MGKKRLIANRGRVLSATQRLSTYMYMDRRWAILTNAQAVDNDGIFQGFGRHSIIDSKTKFLGWLRLYGHVTMRCFEAYVGCLVCNVLLQLHLSEMPYALKWGIFPHAAKTSTRMPSYPYLNRMCTDKWLCPAVRAS